MKKKSKRVILLTALILTLAAAVGAGSAVFADGDGDPFHIVDQFTG